MIATVQTIARIYLKHSKAIIKVTTTTITIIK
jgi:hypothetical protein